MCIYWTEASASRVQNNEEKSPLYQTISFVILAPWQKCWVILTKSFKPTGFLFQPFIQDFGSYVSHKSYSQGVWDPGQLHRQATYGAELGAMLRRDHHLVWCSVIVLKFLSFVQGVPHFHFILRPKLYSHFLR